MSQPTVKSLREKVRLTQLEMSQRLKVSVAIISDWETGQAIPRFDRATALARELQVSLKDLAQAFGIDVSDIPEEIRSGEYRSPLRLLRETVKLTRLELAKRIEVSEHQVYDWENGKSFPRLDQTPTLARELGVSLKTICEAIGIDVAGVPDD